MPHPAVETNAPGLGWQMQAPATITPAAAGSPPSSIERPQTVSYALCDSPSGLLSYILDLLRPQITRTGSPHLSHPPSPTRSRRTTPQEPEGLRFARPYTKTAIINWIMMHWIPGPEAALRWLANSTKICSLLWTNFTPVPLGISQYCPQTQAGAFDIEQTDMPWAGAYQHVIMVRRRVGTVSFAAWERPAEMVMDLREMAELILQSPVQQVPVNVTMTVR